jgi:hypothetical protein
MMLITLEIGDSGDWKTIDLCIYNFPLSIRFLLWKMIILKLILNKLKLELELKNTV